MFVELLTPFEDNLTKWKEELISFLVPSVPSKFYRHSK